MLGLGFGLRPMTTGLGFEGLDLGLEGCGIGLGLEGHSLGLVGLWPCCPLTTLTLHHTFTVSSQAQNSPFPQIFSTIVC